MTIKHDDIRLSASAYWSKKRLFVRLQSGPRMDKIEALVYEIGGAKAKAGVCSCYLKLKGAHFSLDRAVNIDASTSNDDDYIKPEVSVLIERCTLHVSSHLELGLKTW